MNLEEWKHENHKISANFLDETKEDLGDITASVKATIVQFIVNTKRGLYLIAKNNGGYVNTADIIEIQIQELRRCIIDLSQHEQYLNNHKEGLQ
jgi:hypothetical protein